MRCTFFAQGKGVEDSREDERQQDASEDNSSNDKDWRPACHGYSTGEPVKEGLDAKLCVRAESQNQRLKCYQHGVDYDACQQQCDDGSLTTDTRDCIDQ